MKSIYLTILAILLLIGSLGGEARESYLKAYLLSYPQTALEAAVAPLNWDTTDWLTAGGVILVTGGLYLVDEELRDVYQRNRTNWGDDLMTGFKQFGEGKYIIPAMGATILTGYLAGSDKTIDTGLLCLKSFLVAGATTQVLQFASQRYRPSSDKGKEFWNGSGITRKRDSFPSGHTTLVWSLAPILAHQYAETRWLPPLVYTIAALTSYSRLNDNRHWSSDVFAGAVVGYVSARLVLKTTPRLAVTPASDLMGLAFSYEF